MVSEVDLEISEAVTQQIVARCSEVETGARNIDHILSRTLLPLLSRAMLAQMTEAFLQYSRRRGNDLITPMPEYGFPGLKEGDRWCVCAARWLEAAEEGYAPPVILDATHVRALQKIALADLEYHALQDSGA